MVCRSHPEPEAYTLIAQARCMAGRCAPKEVCRQKALDIGQVPAFGATGSSILGVRVMVPGACENFSLRGAVEMGLAGLGLGIYNCSLEYLNMGDGLWGLGGSEACNQHNIRVCGAHSAVYKHKCKYRS